MADPLRQTYGEVFFTVNGTQYDPHGLANFHPASNVNRLDIYLQDGVSTNVVMVNFRADGKGYPTSVFFPTLYGGTVKKTITGESLPKTFAKYSLLVPPQVLQWNANGTSVLGIQATVVQTAGDGLLGAFETYTNLTTDHPATETLYDLNSVAYVYTTEGLNGFGFYSIIYDGELETYTWTLIDEPTVQSNTVDAKQYNIVGMQIQKGNLPRPTHTVSITEEYIRYILAYLSQVNAIALANQAIIGDKVEQNAYIVGSTPLASGWLSLTDGGSALTPAYGTFYIVQDGTTIDDTAYVGLEYIWNGSTYVQYTGDYGTLLYRMAIAEYDIDAIINGTQNITYDPTISGLVATTLKTAVDEVAGLISNMLDGTTVVKKAEQDENGNNIKDTYSTIVINNKHFKDAVYNNESGVLTFTYQDDTTKTIDLALELLGEIVKKKVEDIEDGTTVVKKAEQDEDGNNIKETYATVTYVDGKISGVFRPSGNWNANTNTPTLANNEPTNAGKVYYVTNAGTQFGLTFAIGDKLAFIEGGVATKWDNVDDVTSVNGKEGVVVLTQDDVADGSTYKRVTNALKANYDTAYAHSQETHAPSNAQKNSDITKAEIEAKLTGEINSHTHPGDNNKLDKLTSVTVNRIAYIKNPEGTQGSIVVSEAVEAETIAMRNANGNVRTGTPIHNQDATTKKYVDDAINNLYDLLSNGLFLLGGSY